MRTRISKMWKVAFGIVLGLWIAGAAHADASPRGCSASAPVAASAGAQFHVEPGFTIRRIVTDRMLHQTWAMVEDCNHPERPLQMIQLGAPFSPANVRANRDVHTILAAPTSIASPTQTRMSQVSIIEPVSPSVSAGSNTAAPLPQPLLVRAGDRVHLWSASTNVRLEIEAIALDYGHAGQVIHLRRLGNDRVQTTMLAGLVDGADTAELLP